MIRSIRFRTYRRGLFVMLAAAMIVVVGDRTTAQVGGGGNRQPLVLNQFDNVTGGALSARRPGNYTRQAIAVLRGDSSLLPSGAATPGELVERPNFIRETVDIIVFDFIELFNLIISSLNAIAPSNPFAGLLGGGLGDTGGLGSLFGLLTGGGGGSIPLP